MMRDLTHAFVHALPTQLLSTITPELSDCNLDVHLPAFAYINCPGLAALLETISCDDRESLIGCRFTASAQRFLLFRQLGGPSKKKQRLRIFVVYVPPTSPPDSSSAFTDRWRCPHVEFCARQEILTISPGRSDRPSHQAGLHFILDGAADMLSSAFAKQCPLAAQADQAIKSICLLSLMAPPTS